MNKIYLVCGTTGHYEDTVEWNLCAFPDKESAEAYKQKVKDLYKALCQEFGFSPENSWSTDFNNNFLVVKKICEAMRAKGFRIVDLDCTSEAIFSVEEVPFMVALSS